MRWRLPPRLVRVRVALFICAFALVSAFLWKQGDTSKADNWASILQLMLALATFMLTYMEFSGRSAGASRPAISATLDVLADRILRPAWDADWRQRRLHDPGPLPVAWSNADELADHWSNILGRADATARRLDGRLPDLPAVFGGLPQRRLVLVGEAGAGKSALGLHLARELLACRTPGAAVPVLLNLSSWDPEADSLASWLIERLPVDVSPGLAGNAGRGRTLARALVEDDLVIPILDGLDELPRPHRARAIARINDEAHRPLLLTSREAEYEQALVDAHDVVTGAAAVRLRPLEPDEVSAWLRRTAAGPGAPAAKWDPLIEELSTQGPDSPLRDALDTPLMVSLAREIYSESADDPAALMTIPDKDGLERRLLSRLVPSVYRDGPQRTGARPPDIERVQRRLSDLSRWMEIDGNARFEWWRLHQVLPRLRTRLAKAVLVGAVAAGISFAGGLVTPDPAAPGLEKIAVLLGASLIALSVFVVEAFATASMPLVLTVGFDAARATAALRTLARQGLTGAVLGGSLGMLLGLLLIAAYNLLAPSSSFPSVWQWLAAGSTGVLLAAAFVAILGAAFALLFAAPMAALHVLARPVDVGRTVAPRTLLAADRRWSIGQSVFFGGVVAVLVPFGLFIVGQVMMNLMRGQLGQPVSTIGLRGYDPAAGLVPVGVPAALAYLLCGTAWGRYSVARLWLLLRGRIPVRLMAFLEDACARGALRQVGAIYAFRHDLLRVELARSGGRRPPAGHDRRGSPGDIGSRSGDGTPLADTRP